MDHDLGVDMHLTRVITYEVGPGDGAYLGLKKAIEDAFAPGARAGSGGTDGDIVRRVLTCLKEQKGLDEVLAEGMPEFERFDHRSSSANHFLAYVRGELLLQVAFGKEGQHARAPPPNINVLLLLGCKSG